MKPPVRPKFEFSGGKLCLDFANTARYTPPARDDIGSYAHLVFWAEDAGLLTASEGRRLRRAAAGAPEAARKALDRAKTLRAAIYATFAAIAAERKPAPADLDTLSESAVAAGRHFRIVPKDGAYAWELATGTEGLERPLWPIARSAAELLTSDELGTVRECALETCAWLFTDSSRNQKRRWCDMKICGNRSKARRHYQRVREAGS
jgi:predicted RNA-binding Zn ribbon-like protein